MVKETKSPGFVPGPRRRRHAFGTKGPDQEIERDNAAKEVKGAEIERRPQAEDETADKGDRRKLEPKTLRQKCPPRNRCSFRLETGGSRPS